MIKNKWWRENVDTYVGLIVITSFIPPFMLYDLDYLGLMAILYFIFSGAVSVLLHVKSLQIPVQTFILTFYSGLIYQQHLKDFVALVHYVTIIGLTIVQFIFFSFVVANTAK